MKPLLIKIPRGTRFTVDKTRYQAVDTANVDAMAVETGKAQTNQHLSLACPDDACEAEQARIVGRKAFRPFRGTKIADSPKIAESGIADGTFRPFCGRCGQRMI